ncbi:hypothetical protein BLIN101_03455 [Brevibacterium linens]|uniref:Uncharacterized protein n=2 Tax=Brevibacteriaceae TaxID=85019 RepID=A0A2H1KLC0_BRELN|nr:hypothetical protein BLIN101_03455 [Brevibacterium linens]
MRESQTVSFCTGELSHIIGEMESSLPTVLIAEVVRRLKLSAPALARLHAHIISDPLVLTRGLDSTPATVTRLIRDLRDSGARVVQLPRCAKCADVRPLVRTASVGKVCARCDYSLRRTDVECGLCHRIRQRRGQVLNTQICQSCWRLGSITGAEDFVTAVLFRTRSAGSRTEFEARLRQATNGMSASICLRTRLEIELSSRDLFADPQFGSANFGTMYDLVRSVGAILPVRACGHCSRQVPLTEKLDGLRTCDRCRRRANMAPCDSCSQPSITSRIMVDGTRLCISCVNRLPQNFGTCSRCGRTKQIGSERPEGLLCRTCRMKERSGTCTSCGHVRPCRFAGTARAICENCALSKEPCSQCRRNKVPANRLADGGSLCATCSPKVIEACADCGKDRQVRARIDGAPYCWECGERNPLFHQNCLRCCRFEYLSQLGLCPFCKAADLVDSLFEGGPSPVANGRDLLREALRAAPPQAVFTLFQRRKSVAVLRSLIAHPGGISHDSLSQVASGSSEVVVRAFLVEHGVLAWRDENLARLEAWIAATADEVADPSERRAFLQFGRWRHLSRLRRQTDPAGDGQVSGIRTELGHIIEVIGWLRSRGSSIEGVNQSLVDNWLSRGPGTRIRVKHFLTWCYENNLASAKVTIPAARATALTVAGITSTEVWTVLDQFLDPSKMISGQTRLAGCLLLIYGIRLGRIAELRLSDLREHDGKYSILIGTDPLELPSSLDIAAIHAQHDRSAPRLMTPATDDDWLFPGGVPGRHLTSTSLAARLRKLGVHNPTKYRKAALTPLAISLPAPVLSRLLGLSISTATTWATAVSSSNASYAAARLSTRPGL